MKSLLRSGFLLTCLTVGRIGSLQAQNNFPATGHVGIGISAPTYRLHVAEGAIGGNYGITPQYASWWAVGLRSRR